MRIIIDGLLRRATRKSKDNYPRTIQDKQHIVDLINQKIDQGYNLYDSVNNTLIEKNANVFSIEIEQIEKGFIGSNWIITNWDEVHTPYRFSDKFLKNLSIALIIACIIATPFFLYYCYDAFHYAFNLLKEYF